MAMRRYRRAVSCYQPTRHAIAVVWDWALRLDLKVDVVSFLPCEEEVERALDRGRSALRAPAVHALGGLPGVGAGLHARCGRGVAR